MLRLADAAEWHFDTTQGVSAADKDAQALARAVSSMVSPLATEVHPHNN